MGELEVREGIVDIRMLHNVQAYGKDVGRLRFVQVGGRLKSMDYQWITSSMAARLYLFRISS
jgi:hypothetical protein